ncbi:MAG: hypothetical protein ABI432_19930 [Flavobacteriales bacterium]
MRTTLVGLASAAVLFTACNKDPGEGGKAEIHGIVYEQRYNNVTNLPVGDPYPIAEQRVYIIYGDGDYADDDTRTEPDGTYRFAWLRKGDYRIYTVSECDTCASGTKGIYVSAEIGDRKEVVDVPLITIENW